MILMYVGVSAAIYVFMRRVLKFLKLRKVDLKIPLIGHFSCNILEDIDTSSLYSFPTDIKLGFLKDYNCGVLIDVGANIGLSTMLYAINSLKR